jgi:hypothetical protein
MFELILFFLIFIILSNSVLLIGGVLNIFFLNRISFFSNKKNLFLQQNLISGFTFFLVLSSFLFSGTLSLFSIPIILFLSFNLNRFSQLRSKIINSKISIVFNFKQLFIWNLAGLFCFLFFVYIFRLDKNVPFFDFLYLSKLASGISESYHSNLFSIYNQWCPTTKPMLYHYSDLWILASIIKLTALSEVKLLIYVVYPLFTLVALTLIKGYVSFIFNKFNYVIAFGILFGLKLFLPTKGEFMELSHMYRGIPFLPFFKLLPIYIYLISFGLFYKLKNYKVAYFFLSLVVIAYPTTVPALAFFSVSLITLHIFKILKNKHDMHGSFLVLGTIIGIIIFQKIFQYKSTTPILFNFLSIKAYAVLLIETYFKIFIEHLLVFILLVWFLTKNRNNLCKILDVRILLFLFSTFGSFVFVYTQKPFSDNNQIISNISPVLILLIFLYLVEFLNKAIIKVVFSIVVLFSIVNILYVSNIDDAKYVNPVNKFSLDWREKSIKILTETNIDNSKIVTLGKEPFGWYFNKDHYFHYLFMENKIKPPLDISILFNNNLKNYCSVYRNEFYPPFNYFHLKPINLNEIYKFLKVKKVRFLLVDDLKNIPDFFIKKIKCRLRYKDIGIFELN